MIEIKRNTITIATSEKYTYSGVFMGERKLTIFIESTNNIDFQENDTAIYDNETYFLRNVPTGVKKFNSIVMTYTLELEHIQAKMSQTSFLDVVPQGEDEDGYYNNTGDVRFIGKVENLAGRLVTNLNRLDTGWTYSVSEEANNIEEQVILDNAFCSDALALINELFKVNYWVIGKHIKIGGVAPQVGHIFEYGKDKGICEITRTGETKAVVTRARVLGGSRNIPRDYNVTADAKYNSRLMLPNFTTTGINYIDSPLIDINNIKEGVITNDEIYPSIEQETDLNTILSMEAITVENQAGFYLHIKDIGFDINDKLTDETARVSMTSGKLKAFEFEIVSCTPETGGYKLFLKRDVSNSDFVMPNNITSIVNGDKYVLLGIEMDESYVLNAETRLLDWANKQYSEQNIDKPKTSYSAKFTEEFLHKNTGIKDQIKEGSLVRIKDTDFNVDEDITIQSLTVSYGDNFLPKYDLSIAKQVIASKFTAAIEKANNVERDVIYKLDERDIQSKRTVANLRALELENRATIFGNAINNYVLEGSVIPNFGGDENVAYGTEGRIQHRGVNIFWGNEDTAASRIWVINNPKSKALVGNFSYYVYIKANKTDQTAEWIFSEIELIQDTGAFFYFEYGVIFPVSDGRRDIEATKGIVAISGDQIYAGKISSLDKKTFIDLTNNAVKIGNDSKGIDWNITNPDTFSIKGGLVVSPSGVQQHLGVYRGEWVDSLPYYEGDTVFYSGSSYQAKHDNLNSMPPSSDWQAVALKGNDFSFDQGDQAAFDAIIVADQEYGYTFFNTEAGLLYIIINNNGVKEWSEGSPFGKGEDGTTHYTWIAYTNVLDKTLGVNGKTLGVNGKTLGVKGTELMFTNLNAKYMGVGSNKTTPNASLHQADYTWIQVRGDSGADGADGADGVAGDYFEYRYALNGSTTSNPTLDNDTRNPSGWTTIKPSVPELNILWSTKARISGISDGLVDNWEVPLIEEKGKGSNISLIDKGEWSGAIQYIGSPSGVSAVFYNDHYYWSRVDAGNIPIGTPPTNMSYWNPFDSQAFATATNLLLAKKATIRNLQVEAAEITGKLKAVQIETDEIIVNKIKTSENNARIEVNTPEYPNKIGIIDSENTEIGVIGEFIDNNNIPRTGVAIDHISTRKGQASMLFSPVWGGIMLSDGFFVTDRSLNGDSSTTKQGITRDLEVVTSVNNGVVKKTIHIQGGIITSITE